MGGRGVTSGMVSAQASGGAHTSRTMQLPGLDVLLEVVPAEAESSQYKDAVIEHNVLGKKTLNSRQRSYRYLRELYALDPDILLFRALRDLWEQTPTTSLSSRCSAPLPVTRH